MTGPRGATGLPVRAASLARIRIPALPSAPFLVSASLTAAFLLAWNAYLFAARRPIVVPPCALAVLGVVLTALTCEERQRPHARGRRLLGRLSRPGPALVAAIAVLAGGLTFRLLTWPHLMRAGDSAEYDLAARTAAVTQTYDLLPWRTPGYAFSLFWTYTLAGIHNPDAVRAWQTVLSLLTAVTMMGIAYLVTRRRAIALLALVVGALAYPIAAPSAYLMSEGQAMFLATLALLLLLAVYRQRHVGAAMLALGPVLALAYETRTALLPWVVVIAAAALLVRPVAWRQRTVLVAGAIMTLAPVAATNALSPYRVLTPGPAVDLVAQVLGEDRFSLYWTAPNSPELLESFQQAVISDGAETEYWVALRPAEVARFHSGRLTTMERYILDHAGSFVSLSLRRAPLLYRYDQPWDLTYGRPVPGAWLVLVDVLLLLALLGAVTWALRGSWPPVVMLGLPVLALTLFLSLFHVEPRYSLPALPAVAVLAVMGLAWLSASLRAGVAHLRDGTGGWTRLAPVTAAVAGLLVAVTAMEAWLWPALPDAYAPRPRPGQYQTASCYVGHHLLTAVAWRPGTSSVIAGGANGLVVWDVARGGCPWLTSLQDNAWDVGYSRDGTRLGVGSYHARAVDAATWGPYPGFQDAPRLSTQGTEILSVSLDPAGRRLAFAATGLRYVGVFDIDRRQVVATAVTSSSPAVVRWSPDGSTIAVGGSDRSLRLFGPQLQPLRTLPLPHPALALAWAPSGDLAAGDDHGGLSVWTRDALLRASSPTTVAAHGGAIHALSYSPDGASLASASSDRLARIWRAAGLEPERTLRGHTAAVWGVDWSPDSSSVVTASADGSMGLWSAR